MRLAEFHRLISGEFGTYGENYLLVSHVLATLGGTPQELIDAGVDPGAVWDALCEDFEVPAERRLGLDPREPGGPSRT